MFDIAIIGGGVNGCGIARDAAGRGYKVALIEQGDLAQATSSASTKLIHGGLRYLEHYEFRLVHEALKERDVLLKIAPHNVRPLRFVLPHHKGLRPRWMLRLGLALYDALGGGGLPGAESLDLARDPAGAPLKEMFRHGFAYSDCWTDDARLVVLNAIDAGARGAEIWTRAKLVGARRAAHAWRVTVQDERGAQREIEARALINAAGAWVAEVQAMADVRTSAGVRLVQGSHIVVRKLFDHDRAYIFQQADGRIVFAIPYERDFTLIGTTDRDWTGDPAAVSADGDEIAYLCAAANEYFKRAIAPADVVWTYSGVRALYDDGASAAQEVTRDYVLHLDAEGPAMLSLFGGKITTYRKLAEAALAKLAPHLPAAKQGPWTKTAALPGGDFAREQTDALVNALCEAHAFLSQDHALRLVRAYGARARRIFEGANGPGEVFCADLSAREVDYLIAHEWACSAEDILWRRTKLGLRASKEEAARLEDYVRAKRSA